MINGSWHSMDPSPDSTPASFIATSDDLASSESSWESSSSLHFPGFDRAGVADKMHETRSETTPAGITPPTVQKPFSLLDLPVDILKDVVKEINHTNDLTSLALAHSALHALVIPQMYSRFDIVWPDQGDDPEPRVGVDALAYGLSTLVMSGESYGAGNTPSISNTSCATCSNCGHAKEIAQTSESNYHRTKRRRGNNYAQYTRKFSLGNGPANLLEPYMISAESGKMLGTLVAIAIVRMQNLETFVWDMPTGVIREVWEALASLSKRTDGGPSRLSSVWLRCHNSTVVRSPTNYLQALPRLQMILGGLGRNASTTEVTTKPLQTVSANLESLRRSYRQIEHPNFSILPPLKSISVLDIDQIAYFEELSILVERSIECLRELRIGSSYSFDPLKDQSQNGGPNEEPEREDGLSYLGAGGALGMMMSKFHDCRRKRPTHPKQAPEESLESTKQPQPADGINDIIPPIAASAPIEDVTATDDINLSPADLVSAGALTAPNEPVANSALIAPVFPNSILDSGSRPEELETLQEVSNETLPQAVHKPTPNNSSIPAVAAASGKTESGQKHVLKRRKLKLQVLELERISLSIPVLQKALDWKFLTDITLLHCQGDEELWKALAQVYFARPLHVSHESNASTASAQDYPLKLRRIYTNGVSPSLIAFIRDNLAPNTLECLLLQDRAGYKPSKRVSISSIYRGPLRRHRMSLRKVSIDSLLDKKGSSHAQTWKRWMLNRETVTFIMSGKMPSLRELAVALDYNDWHYFLQHLPQMPHIRSLYVPHMNEHVYGHQLNAMELALQVLDIVMLRPEIELCYVGILEKCFEILERNHPENEVSGSSASTTHQQWHVLPIGHSILDDSSDDFSIPSADSDEEEEDLANDSDAADSETVSEHSVSDVDESAKEPRLRLREILFFVEKVEIFKVRHGTLC